MYLKMVIRGHFIPNREEVLLALRNKPDRTLILSSLIIAKFEFAYDLFTLLGKYFHVQN